MDIVHEGLVYRANRCFEAQPANAPMLFKYGAFGKRLQDDEDVTQLFKGRRATISVGYIGIYETVTAVSGNPNWETDPEWVAFSEDILRRMKERCDTWSNELDVHFSIYSSPSESTTDRLCRMDKERYGVIPDVTDKDYYTNSYHLDVRKAWTPFEKIDFEKRYPKYASGGFIHYVEAVIPESNLKGLETLWDYAHERVGYFGVNTPIDKCYECGFSGDFEPTAKGYKCPECGNNNPETTDVVKRQCGYLGQPQLRPNVYGRKREIDTRVKHVK